MNDGVCLRVDKLRLSLLFSVMFLFCSGCIYPSGQENTEDFNPNSALPPLPSTDQIGPIDQSDGEGINDTQRSYQCRFTSTRVYHEVEPGQTNPAPDPASNHTPRSNRAIPMALGDRDLLRYEFEMGGGIDSVWLEVDGSIRVVSGETLSQGPYPDKVHTVQFEIELEAQSIGEGVVRGYFRGELTNGDASWCKYVVYQVD